MLSFASLMEADGAEEPLLVFPKAVSGINNIHNLTLALTSPDGHRNNNNNNNNSNSFLASEATPPSDCHSNKSDRQPSADLGQILSQGQISFSQLEYSKLLGKGNSGTGMSWAVGNGSRETGTKTCVCVYIYVCEMRCLDSFLAPFQHTDNFRFSETVNSEILAIAP